MKELVKDVKEFIGEKIKRTSQDNLAEGRKTQQK